MTKQHVEKVAHMDEREGFEQQATAARLKAVANPSLTRGLAKPAKGTAKLVEERRTVH